MSLKQRKFEYKWIILAICFLMVFVCLGFCSSNKGLYLSAITEALGIERSLFSINDSCRFIATAIVNLFFGSLIYKFGVRKMTVFGFITLIASMLIYAFAENIFVFYIGGILLGVGLSFTTTTMASSVIRRWFRKDIGKYTGIVLAANGIGGAVAAQIISPMINEEGNAFGYRNSYIFVAVLLLVVGIVVISLMREWPKEENEKVVVVAKKKARGGAWVGIDYKIAKTRPYFFLTAAAVLLTGFGLQGISGVYAAHMKDVGLNAEYVALVVSVHSLTLTVCKILIGALYDRFGLKVVTILCHCATVVSFLLMSVISASAFGMVAAMAFSLLYSLALPLETLVIPLIANDLFGNASYDKILGFLIAMNYTGYALGAPVVNLCYDTFGTYVPILLVLSGIMLIVTVMFQFVIKSAGKDKAAILAASADAV